MEEIDEHENGALEIVAATRLDAHVVVHRGESCVAHDLLVFFVGHVLV